MKNGDCYLSEKNLGNAFINLFSEGKRTYFPKKRQRCLFEKKKSITYGKTFATPLKKSLYHRAVERYENPGVPVVIRWDNLSPLVEIDNNRVN